MSWQIKKQDIPLVALGAKLIACGGGGDTKSIQNLLMSIMKDEESITVKTIVDLEDEWIVGTGMMGSTIFYNENIPTGIQGSRALKVYESIIEQKIGAIIPVEIGGVNGLEPLLMAYQNNLPVVDGDGMGKAFPELSMTTYHLNKIPVSPMVLETHDAYTVLQGNEDIQITSVKTKNFIAKSGGYVHFVGFGSNARKMKTSMISGSLNLIYRLGSALMKETSVSEKRKEMMAVFENSLYGKPISIITGVVTEVSRWFEEGALIGKFTVEGRSSYSNKRMEIEFRNEFIAIKEKQYRWMTPDLILVLDDEKLSPYNVSEIQIGLAVTIFAVPAPNILRTKDMLELVGPENYGLAVTYQPLQGDQSHEAWN
jgi:uncharacterized protein